MEVIQKNAGVVGAHYVLIIEWLGDDDRKTGSTLAERISAGDNAQVVLRSCQSADDVRQALREAYAVLLDKGRFPVVHFEAHGAEPERTGGSSKGLVGPQGDLLTWESLTDELSPFNVATGFRLVVIGAACHGLATLGMFHIGRAAPFTVVVGFNSTVAEGRLYEAMRTFYFQMFRGGHYNIMTAVEHANRELLRDEGEWLIATTFYRFAVQLITSFLRKELEPTRFTSEARRLLAKAQAIAPVPDDVEVFSKTYRDGLLHHCEVSVGIWFAYDQVRDNRIRFAIDVREIAARALGNIVGTDESTEAKAVE